MTTPAQTVADQLPCIGLPESLYTQIYFAESTGWPPLPGCRPSPDFSPARIWARVDLAEWLDTAPHVFGPHRTNELATLAAIGSKLRNAGEGTLVLWALDIIEPRVWVDHPTTALAVTELVCIGPKIHDSLLTHVDAALTGAFWTPTRGAEPNSACTINHTPCHYSAWNDATSIPQYQPPMASVPQH